MILLPQECVKYTARNLQYRHKAHSICMDDRVYWRTSVTVQTECFFCHISFPRFTPSTKPPQAYGSR